MPTNSVAFTTDSGPIMVDGAPEWCLVFEWVTGFFVTQGSGLQPGIQPVSGFIVQREDMNRVSRYCDGKPDPKNSNQVTHWVTFKLSDGAGQSEGTDTVRLYFPKERKTAIDLTLAASYHAAITGATRTEINPLTSEGGADGTLNKQPDNFLVTLTRHVRIEVDCCGDAHTFSFTCRAFNSYETYSETWRQTHQQEMPEHEKIVDGLSVQ